MDQFISSTQGALVEVHVGPADSASVYTVPKALLAAGSAWFASALRENGFKEGITGTITLTDDSAKAFEAFLYFLYHGHLKFPDLDGLNKEERSADIECCIRIWIFGDKYGLRKVQNAAILRLCDALVHLKSKDDFSDAIKTDILALCFQYTTAGSPLRKVAADLVVYLVEYKSVPPSWFAGLGTCDGFVEELFRAQRELRESRNQDYPRFFKPLKFRSLFEVKEDEEYDNNTIYRPTFHAVEDSCSECGLRGGKRRCVDCEAEERVDCGCDAGYVATCTRCHEWL